MKKRRILSALLALITAAGTAIGAAGAASAADESPYKDVKKSWWSYPYVMYATEHGYMNGMGGGKFEPQGTMTRAMVVTVLYRIQGEPKVKSKVGFDDVKTGAWYANAVYWAAENNIVNGVETGKFAPEDNITREQLAAIIMRYAPQEFINTDDRKDITGYSDYKKVHEYARDAMSWTNAVGLITGVTKKTLEPRSSATREQFAVILKRFKEEAEFTYNLVYNEPTVHSEFTEIEYKKVDDADIYVAVDGNDSNPGTIDKPVATFARAKEMVRELKKTATSEIVVAFKAGNYGSLENLTFSAEDSGSESVPIRYCAYGDGEVLFQNGYKIAEDSFKPIEDGDKYLFKEKFYDDIYKVSLADYITKASDVTTLFSGSGICYESRYPNKDGTTDVSFSNMTTTVDKYCSIQLQAVLPKVVEGFRTTEGMRVTGFLRVGWLVETFDVKSYDPETKVLTFNTYEGFVPASGYPIGESAGGFDFMFEGRTTDTVFFSNLSDQLDYEGEYWIDPDTLMLYVYKPEGEYTVATGGQFMGISNTDYVSFVGLSFDASKGSPAFMMSHCDNFTFDSCTFSNMSDKIIHASRCLNFTMKNSELYNFGATGLYIDPQGKHLSNYSDAYQSMKSCGLVIENNYFHDFGFVNMWSDAVNIYCASGARIAYNYFKNGAHAAVEYNSANYTVVEYNIFDNMMMTTADYGAVYTNWGFEDRSNVVRYNMFKNIRNAGAQYSIYLDGDSNNTEIYGNLFYDAGTCGVTINGGRDHLIHDNVYIQNKNDGRFLFTNLNPATAEYLYEDDFSYEPGSANEMKTLVNDIPHEGHEGYEEWKERWPILYRYNDDFANLGDPDCLFTTINYVYDNYLIGDEEIKEDAYVRFTPEENKKSQKYLDLDDNPFFKDPTHGDYTIVGSDFVLPVAEMGRY